MEPISDGLLYQEDGDYTRYTVPQTILVIDISESKSYVKNIQEPIVRENEVIFEAVLFTSKLSSGGDLIFLRGQSLKSWVFQMTATTVRF